MSKNIEEFAWLRDRLLPLETFNSAASWSTIRNFFKARRRLLQRIATDNVGTVVTLMPHIWTPLLARSIRARGTEYVTIMHELVSHPGDPTASVLPWLRSEARLADHVVTLSRAVADHMIGHGFGDCRKTHALFLPDLRYDSVFGAKSWSANEPLRLLFMGRILRYKGLSLLLDAIEMLRADGLQVRLGVAGAGDIDVERERLTGLGAEVINRWLEDKGNCAAGALRRDGVALYRGESFTGVAAVAFGSCMPVIAMPSGGLAEQVIEGKTGVLAQYVSARSFADGIRRLATNPSLYAQISRSLEQGGPDRSMRTFIEHLLRRHGGEIDMRAPLKGE